MEERVQLEAQFQNEQVDVTRLIFYEQYCIMLQPLLELQMPSCLYHLKRKKGNKKYMEKEQVKTHVINLKCKYHKKKRHAKET